MAFKITVNNTQFLVPTSSDPCELWRGFYIDLKRKVGPVNARKVWLFVWSYNGSDLCTTSTGFNRFLKANKIDVSSAATRSFAHLVKTGENFLSLSSGLTKALSVAIPITLAAALIIAIVIAFNLSRQKNLSNLTSLASGGKLSGLKALVK